MQPTATTTAALPYYKIANPHEPLLLRAYLPRSVLHPVAIEDLADTSISWDIGTTPFADGTSTRSLNTNGEKLTIPADWLRPGMEYTFTVVVAHLFGEDAGSEEVHPPPAMIAYSPAFPDIGVFTASYDEGQDFGGTFPREEVVGGRHQDGESFGSTDWRAKGFDSSQQGFSGFHSTWSHSKGIGGAHPYRRSAGKPPSSTP